MCCHFDFVCPACQTTGRDLAGVQWRIAELAAEAPQLTPHLTHGGCRTCDVYWVTFGAEPNVWDSCCKCEHTIHLEALSLG